MQENDNNEYDLIQVHVSSMFVIQTCSIGYSLQVQYTNFYITSIQNHYLFIQIIIHYPNFNTNFFMQLSKLQWNSSFSYSEYIWFVNIYTHNLMRCFW